MFERLDAIKEKYESLSVELSKPEVLSDINLTRKYSKEMSELEDIVNCYKKYKKVLEDIESTKEIGVQVNGKVRGKIVIGIDEDEESIKEKALAEENVQRHIDGKEVVKVIVIKGKIVNIVVK